MSIASLHRRRKTNVCFLELFPGRTDLKLPKKIKSGFLSYVLPNFNLQSSYIKQIHNTIHTGPP